jgi:hypothetical protein
MHLDLDRPDPQRLVAKLRDGLTTTEVTGWRPAKAAADLVAALVAAKEDGYGECFWPEPTGQFWWILKREDRTLEVVILYSRGGAMGWQHVFRATDEVDYICDLVQAEVARVGL